MFTEYLTILLLIGMSVSYQQAVIIDHKSSTVCNASGPLFLQVPIDHELRFLSLDLIVVLMLLNSCGFRTVNNLLLAPCSYLRYNVDFSSFC